MKNDDIIRNIIKVEAAPEPSSDFTAFVMDRIYKEALAHAQEKPLINIKAVIAVALTISVIAIVGDYLFPTQPTIKLFEFGSVLKFFADSPISGIIKSSGTALAPIAAALFLTFWLDSLIRSGINRVGMKFLHKK